MLTYFLSRLTNSNKPWFKNDKPWLVIGKGPSFKKVWDLDLNNYYVFGLNHVCNIINCDIGHCIDLEVLNREFIDHSKTILLPWHPHCNFKVVKEDLNQISTKHEFLRNLDNLYYYNCSTYKGNHPLEKEIIKVKYFSGEVPFYLLGLCGVREIHSIGIDGGTKYSSYFHCMQALTNGRKSFDESITMIKRSCIKFGINWVKL